MSLTKVGDYDGFGSLADELTGPASANKLVFDRVSNDNAKEWINRLIDELKADGANSIGVLYGGIRTVPLMVVIDAKADAAAVASALAEKVDKVTGKGLSTNDYTAEDKAAVGTIPDKADADDVDAALAGKVDKVTGKGLSANDYTAEDKAAVGTIPQKADADDVDAALAGKADADDVDAALAGKVNKVAGKGLSTNDYTDADKAAVGTIPDKADAEDVEAALAGKVDKVGEHMIFDDDNVTIFNDAGSELFADPYGIDFTAAEGDAGGHIGGLADLGAAADGDRAVNKNTLDAAVNPIKAVIPPQATVNNQLGDKEFINSSINSVTAFYITKSAAGDPFDTKAQLFAARTVYSGGVVRVPTRNDYAFVLADETHSGAAVRYIYQNGWQFQFVVNETAFTAAQLAALNSGITAEKVQEIGVVPRATASTFGGVKVLSNPCAGIVFTGNDQLRTAPATTGKNGEIDIRNRDDLTAVQKTAIKYKPICPEKLDYAVIAALTTNSIAMTAAQKTAALTWLGVAAALARKADASALAGKADKRGRMVFTQSDVYDYERGTPLVLTTNTDYVAISVVNYPDWEDFNMSFDDPGTEAPIPAQDGDTINISFKTGDSVPPIWIGGTRTIVGDTPKANSYVEYSAKYIYDRWIVTCKNTEESA